MVNDLTSCGFSPDLLVTQLSHTWQKGQPALNSLLCLAEPTELEKDSLGSSWVLLIQHQAVLLVPLLCSFHLSATTREEMGLHQPRGAEVMQLVATPAWLSRAGNSGMWPHPMVTVWHRISLALPFPRPSPPSIGSSYI